jgi:hypothetical protein
MQQFAELKAIFTGQKYKFSVILLLMVKNKNTNG